MLVPEVNKVSNKMYMQLSSLSSVCAQKGQRAIQKQLLDSVQFLEQIIVDCPHRKNPTPVYHIPGKIPTPMSTIPLGSPLCPLPHGKAPTPVYVSCKEVTMESTPPLSTISLGRSTPLCPFPQEGPLCTIPQGMSNICQAEALSTYEI